MARSATARRLAVVAVATAFASMAGVGAASASPSRPEPAPAAPAATGGLLGGLTDTLNTTLNGLLNGVPASSPDAKAPALGKTVDHLTNTVKELPLLGPTLGTVTDTVGLSSSDEGDAQPAPAKPQTGTPADKAGKDKGRTDRAGQNSPAGSTWTAPMTANLPTGVARSDTEPAAPRGGVSGFLRDVTSLLPSNASEAAAAGAGAATIALIVLGGIAVTGAAGAASAAGRRGLVSGSMGGSL